MQAGRSTAIRWNPKQLGGVIASSRCATAGFNPTQAWRGRCGATDRQKTAINVGWPHAFRCQFVYNSRGTRASTRPPIILPIRYQSRI